MIFTNQRHEKNINWAGSIRPNLTCLKWAWGWRKEGQPEWSQGKGQK